MRPTPTPARSRFTPPTCPTGGEDQHQLQHRRRSGTLSATHRASTPSSSPSATAPQRHRLLHRPSPSPPPTWRPCSAPSSPTAAMTKATVISFDANAIGRGRGRHADLLRHRPPRRDQRSTRRPAWSRGTLSGTTPAATRRPHRQRRQPHRYRFLHLDGHRARLGLRPRLRRHRRPRHVRRGARAWVSPTSQSRPGSGATVPASARPPAAAASRAPSRS